MGSSRSAANLEGIRWQDALFWIFHPHARIITRAGQQRYAQAMRNSGADEVIIPEHEGGLMVGRMIEKYSIV